MQGCGQRQCWRTVGQDPGDVGREVLHIGQAQQPGCDRYIEVGAVGGEC